MNGVILALVLYLLAVTAVGVASARRSSESLSEFYLGGRAMNEHVVALSAVVSGRSAWLMMGMVGLTFAYGVQMAWYIPGYVITELLLFLFVAPRLRRFSARHDSVTFIDYLAARFGDRSGALRIIAAVIIVIFFTAYVGAQLKAGQIMFNLLLGFESVLGGLALMVVIVGFYTVLGGFRAVSITDVIQAGLMIFGLLVLPIAGFAQAGGYDAAVSQLRGVAAAEGSKFTLLAFGSVTGILSGLSIGLGSPGNPHILVRYMSIERPSQLRKAALVGTVYNVLLGWGAVYTGLAARALYTPEVLPDPNNQAFVHMATELLPPFVAGLTLAALLAAIMSTADSQLLVISSSITRDIYEQVICRDRASEPAAAVRLGRITTIVVVLAAGALSWISAGAGQKSVFSTVFAYVLLAWSGLGASFGPPLLLSLFWRRASRAGALSSFISGSGVCILWVATGLKDSTHIHEIIPAFAVSTVLMIAVSLLTAPPEDAGELLRAMTDRQDEPAT